MVWVMTILTYVCTVAFYAIYSKDIKHWCNSFFFFFHVQVDISQHDRKIIEEIDVCMCEIVCDVFSGPCPVNRIPEDHS